MNDEFGCTFALMVFLLGFGLGVLVSKSMSSHEQGVRDALAGKYVVVQLPDGSSVVVENKEGAKP